MLETEMGESMRFELDSGQTKCISEGIRTNAMSVGKYAIVNPHQDALPHSHKLTVKVCMYVPNLFIFIMFSVY